MVDARPVCPIKACTVLRSIPPCKAWVAKVPRNLWSHQVSGSGEDPGVGTAREAWGDSESRQMLEHSIETGPRRHLTEPDAGAVWEAEKVMEMVEQYE
jgi:hypothetical protein